MQVKLEAIGDGIVIDTGGETAGSSKVVTVQTGAAGEVKEFVGRALRVFAASSANGDSQLGESRVKPPLQCAHHRGGDTGGMPVHAHDAAKRLEPEGIADPRQEFMGTIGLNDTLDDGSTELGHALGEPRRDTSAVQGEIGGAGAFHFPIFSHMDLDGIGMGFLARAGE